MALTTLNTVKSWLNITTSTDDVLLNSLINQISLAILNYIQRPGITRTTYNELQNGVGNARIMLRNWPVTGISSLIINTTPVPAAPAPLQAGYTLSTWDGTSAGVPHEVTLYGFCYTRGLNNISVIYQAGYCIQAETHTVPAVSAYTVTVNQPYGFWTQDDGVTYSGGAALTKVTGAPAAGQYSVTSGVYTFNSGDASAAILISYSYTPSDLENACVEWVGERYRYRARIGKTSDSLSGAVTQSYSLKMPDHIKLILQPYKKYLPL